MRRKTFAHMNCSIARALEQIGEWWTFLIVREALMGTRRFDRFQGNLGSPAIFSPRALKSWSRAEFWSAPSFPAMRGASNTE